MRMPVVAVLVAAALPLSAAGGGGTQRGGGDAEAMMRAARGAVGSAAVLSGVRSVVLRGQRRVLNGASGRLSAPSPVEIRILFPDHYLQVYEWEGVRFRSGFSGDRLLNDEKPVRPGIVWGRGSYGPEEIGKQRAGFSRLVLGMFARVSVVLDLIVRPSAPDTIEVSGRDGFSALLDLDPGTRTPLRVRYHGNVHFPTPGSVAPGAAERAEITQTFGDRRSVSRLQLPQRITKAARGIVLEELALSEIRVNAPLSPKDFVE